VSATYRIEVSRADDAIFPWEAKIVRLSDDWPMHVERRSNADGAIYAARQWIKDESLAPVDLPLMVYVDDQGDNAEAPQSVKV
jgi:hypothetical protein